MHTRPIRLNPGADLRRALEAAVAAEGCRAAFVVSGIGSLSVLRLRYAGRDDAEPAQTGSFEILTIASNGSHLHAALSTADGQVLGGHVAKGCIVRTTVEVLLALLPEWEFRREADAGTGYAELPIRQRAGRG
jgi:predicted DNA-binding protein with PD1-like motif